MRIRIIETGRRIAPFDDPVAEVLIANRPLSAWQEEMFAGFERVDSAPCLVVPDTLYSTHALLKRFVEKAAGKNAVAVLQTSMWGQHNWQIQPAVEQTEQGWRFTEVRYESGGDEEAVDITLDPEESVFELKLSAVFGGSVQMGLPRHPMLTIQHWVHIQRANLAAGSVEVRNQPWWKTVPKVLWAWIRARFSLNKWRVLAKLNTIGKNCDIHPTAVIEGSTLGDNVTVGPFARVIFSRLGDGATVMTGAEVEACTLGEGATVAQRSGLRLSVLYPNAFASQLMMQACVLGRDVFTTPASYSLDLNLDREIRVMLDGTLHTTGSRFLGSAFGHGARIGAGVWLASGREVPNGTVAIRNPDLIAQSVQPDAEGPLVVSGGKLVPFERG